MNSVFCEEGSLETRSLKLLYDQGTLTTDKVKAQKNENFWTLYVFTNYGSVKTVTRARTNVPKEYKSTDAVISDLRKIGFKNVNIEFTFG